MLKIFLALSFITLILNSKPAVADEAIDPELAADVQLDGQFEENNNQQLETDHDYVVKDSISTQKELASEKTRVDNLRNKNEKLTADIKKNAKLAAERRKQVAVQTSQAQRLENQLAQKEKQLEQIKIKNVELRKSIDELNARRMQAMHKARIADAKRKQALAANKRLHERRAKIIKLSKSNRIRTAGL